MTKSKIKRLNDDEAQKIEVWRDTLKLIVPFLYYLENFQIEEELKKWSLDLRAIATNFLIIISFKYRKFGDLHDFELYQAKGYENTYWHDRCVINTKTGMMIFPVGHNTTNESLIDSFLRETIIFPANTHIEIKDPLFKKSIQRVLQGFKYDLDLFIPNYSKWVLSNNLIFKLK